MSASVRALSVTLPITPVLPCDEDATWVCCLGCGAPLELHQPDAGEPQRFVGTCDQCGRWYLLDWVPNSGSSGNTVRGIDPDASRCALTRRRFHPTRAYFDSWIARIFSLKNSRSRNPYACRFIVLILLLVPSIGPLLIITS
jgi:hypothetical protein